MNAEQRRRYARDRVHNIFVQLFNAVRIEKEKYKKDDSEVLTNEQKYKQIASGKAKMKTLEQIKKESGRYYNVYFFNAFEYAELELVQKKNKELDQLGDKFVSIIEEGKQEYYDKLFLGELKDAEKFVKLVEDFAKQTTKKFVNDFALVHTNYVIDLAKKKGAK